MTIAPSPTSVVAQVAQLPHLSMRDLKALWKEIHGEMPRTHVRTFLEKQLAYQLQARALPPESRKLIKRNQQRITALIDAEKIRKKPSYLLTPGTILTREYQGEEYQVTVTLQNQFEFQGRVYGSLSMVARDITGTRWSGPLFFGLRKSNSNPKK